MPQELFVEVFPLLANSLPPLTAFILSSAATTPLEGGKVARRLSRSLGGRWLWAEGRLLSDADCSPIQLEIALDVIKGQEAALLEGLVGLREDAAWASTPQAQAIFAERVLARALEDEVRAALNGQSQPLGQARIERELNVQALVVDGQPALALSIKSRLVAIQTLAQVLSSGTSPAEVLGWTACDRLNPDAQGEITALVGTLATERARLLGLARRAPMLRLLNEAADDDPVLRLSIHGQPYDYAASALWVVLSAESPPEHLSRWGVTPAQAQRALRLRPDARAALIRSAADVLKAHQLVGNAYNTRTHPHLFTQVDFMPECLYGENRARPYDLATMASDFQRHKVYARHPRYEDAPITLAVINALDDRAADFVEALRRLLERQFDFQINLLKERRIKVFTEKNIESAVRVLEKEAPDLLLAIFPNSDAAPEGEAIARALQQQCRSKGLALHILHERTLDDPNATPLVAMSLLAKSGSAPYVLAEGLDYADLVVGLGIVREHLTRKERLSLLNRVYRADGLFLGYHFNMIELEGDAVPPADFIPSLFPKEVFSEKAVILHHDGEMPRDILRGIGQWAARIGMSLGVVEVYRWNAPRLYGLEKVVSAPAWGSAFCISDDEAYVVASAPSADSTPQPLRLRVVGHSLPIEQALYSVLAWTLLHYGAQGVNKLPVTLSAAENMAEWLGRGLRLPRSGDVPFWL